MTVTIINGPPTPKKTQSVSKSAYREYKISLFFKQRREIEDAFFEELNGKQVPDEVEAAIDTGAISPQEIIDLYQRSQVEPLGPNQRRYVVANVLATLIGLGKAPGANTYVPEVADLIIEQMAEGRSIRAICKNKYMPNFSRMMHWLATKPELKERYEIAQKVQVEALVARALDEAMNPRVGIKTIRKPDGTVETIIDDAIPRSRLAVDTIKWFASKVCPKLYGTNNEVEGGGVDNKLTVKIIGGLPESEIPEGPLEDNENEEKLKILGGLSADAVGGLPDVPLLE
jgi:hypothetical protein